MHVDYSTSLCPLLALPKPQDCIQEFDDVVTQEFPLRADSAKVEAFCDEYFNLPGSSLKFVPLAPWIILQVCQYKKAGWSRLAGRPFVNRWFAQHEVAFAIPVRVLKNDKFDGLALVHPFMFVDNPLSMEGGRQIYGWPKAGITIASTLPEFEPNEPRCLVRANITPFNQTDPQLLLEVFQQRPFLSGRSGVADAIGSVPRAIGGYLSATSGTLDTIGHLLSSWKLPNLGSAGENLLELSKDLQSWGSVVQQFYGSMNSLLPSFLNVALGEARSRASTTGANITLYTMKQVRDAVRPETACFQALVRSKMTIKNVRDGGLLFDPISGDPTGGITISFRNPNDYVGKLMGMLLTPTFSRSKAAVHGHNEQTCTVRPIMPFWAILNLDYGVADYQRWRTKYTDWADDGEHAPLPNPAQPQRIDYIQRGSGSNLEVSGKRVAKEALLQLFALPVNARKLRQEVLQPFLDSFTSSIRSPFRFTAQKNTPYIYVTLLRFEGMTIGGRGEYAGTVMTFSISVDYNELEANRRVVANSRKRALIPLYTFVNSDWNFVTQYEVYGRLSFRSSFTSPEAAWANTYRKGQVLLKLSTTLFSSEKGDRIASEGPIVKITSLGTSSARTRTPAGTIPRNRMRAYLANRGLDRHRRGQDVRPNETHTSSIALKQVRNALDPSCADYQSLVCIDTCFEYRDRGRYEEVEFAIKDYQGVSAVQGLGRGRSSQRDGGWTTTKVEALTVPIVLTESQGKEMWRRVAGGDGTWEKC
jgi:hypothetical protein